MAATVTYDPLAVAPGVKPDSVDFVIRDHRRQRDIPVRLYISPSKSTSPVILFSHGLGGSREGSSYLGVHWAARGYVAIFLQHPGSDNAVWKGKPAEQRRDALQTAATIQNFLLRVQDVTAVLDELSDRSKMSQQVPISRLDLNKVGISGHSFGAITTQWLSGQTTEDSKARFTDPRISAALIMSPSSPRRGTPEQAFGSVARPWMLMTGTRDIALVSRVTMKSRLAVFPALPPVGKYEVVLFDAHHFAFTDSVLTQGMVPRNPNHHRAILALSTAFWDTHLRGEPTAKEWLAGDGPNSVLERRDRWRTK
jgi:predicted dienelactone hydrolase